MACEGAAGAPKIINVSAGSDLRVDWVGATSELDGKPGTGNVPAGQNPWVHALVLSSPVRSMCLNACCWIHEGWVPWRPTSLNAPTMTARPMMPLKAPGLSSLCSELINRKLYQVIYARRWRTSLKNTTPRLELAVFGAWLGLVGFDSVLYREHRIKSPWFSYPSWGQFLLDCHHTERSCQWTIYHSPRSRCPCRCG